MPDPSVKTKFISRGKVAVPQAGIFLLVLELLEKFDQQPHGRTLIVDLRQDNEAHFDRAKAHCNRAAVRSVGNRFDLLAAGNARSDPIRIPDEVPDTLDRCRNAELLFDIHIQSQTCGVSASSAFPASKSHPSPFDGSFPELSSSNTL